MYGKRIKELRIERGYTQQELADILHTSQKTRSEERRVGKECT